MMTGRRVSISSTGICGFARGLSEEGALLVELDSGEVRKIHAGEVTFSSLTDER